jgi:hypothetical protein
VIKVSPESEVIKAIRDLKARRVRGARLASLAILVPKGPRDLQGRRAVLVPAVSKVNVALLELEARMAKKVKKANKVKRATTALKASAVKRANPVRSERRARMAQRGS